jgi:hypothetical protein
VKNFWWALPFLVLAACSRPQLEIPDPTSGLTQADAATISGASERKLADLDVKSSGPLRVWKCSAIVLGSLEGTLLGVADCAGSYPGATSAQLTIPVKVEGDIATFPPEGGRFRHSVNELFGEELADYYFETFEG